MATLHSPHLNHLLAGLARADYATLEANLEYVSVRAGGRLSESGDRARHVYFPTTAVVSLVHILRSGASTEIALVGREGLAGITSLLSPCGPPGHALVQIAGHAYRIRSEVLGAEFARSAGLREVLLRFTQALLTQIGQTAVCNRHHGIEQQLCRWLLLCADRAPARQLTITQEAIAQMLGVRREGITTAERKLQDAGVIDYSRGRVVLLDRAGLESRACDCYGIIRREYARLLGPSAAGAGAAAQALATARAQR